MARTSTGPLNNLSKWNLNEGVSRKLRGTGFDTLRGFARNIRLNLGILEALIKNYDSEKKTFILGSSTRSPLNMTFGLEDVLYITGLPIDGMPVTGVDPADTKSICQDLLGLSDNYGVKGLIKLEWLRKNFMSVPEHISVLDKRFDYYVRAYVMYVIGCTFAPSAHTTVSNAFLPLLANVAGIRRYAWGAAYLACLHHGMATGNKSFCGFYFPLLVFVYMRFPGLLCGALNNPRIRDRFPLAVYWSHALSDSKVMMDSFTAHNVEGVSHFFDNLAEETVVWRPYAELPPEFLPLHLREQLFLRTSLTILICFEKAVYHRPDCCKKQLGLEGLEYEGKPIRIQTKQRTGVKSDKNDTDGTDWRTKVPYSKYISI